MPRRILNGIVVSDISHKTISVLVEKKFEHPLYKKYIKRSCKYAVHDPENSYKKGDQVSIIEGKPISKTKKWHIFDRTNFKVESI